MKVGTISSIANLVCRKTIVFQRNFNQSILFLFSEVDFYESGVDESATVSVDTNYDDFLSDSDNDDETNIAGPSLSGQDEVEPRMRCGLLRESGASHSKSSEDYLCVHKMRNQQLISFCKLTEPKLKYFTGVEEKEFKLLLDVITIPAGFKACSEDQIDTRDQFLLTLMKLRLNFDSMCLGHLFNVKESFVDQVVEHWIHRMYIALKGVNFWSLHEKQPGQYDVVIGCLEVPLETTTELGGPSSSDSNGDNTMKALIGVRESGAVVYCSSMWGGSTSIQDILVDSDFLNFLSEGQHILADHTFNVSDILEKKKVSVNIPSLKNVERLTPQQAAVVKRIADRRKIVDKVIASAKEYKVLCQPIPVKSLPICEEMVFVVANIMNFKTHLIEASNQ